MKNRDDELFLHEAALLLALQDEDGTISTGSMYQYALGGGLAAELLLQERAAVETEGRKDYLKLVSSRKTGDPVLDECLAALGEATRRKTIQSWVQKFASIKRLKHRIAEGLCRKGLLRAVEDRVLVIFNRTVYPAVDRGPEARLVERIRNAVLSDGGGLDPKLVVLIALAHHTGLLRTALARKEIKARRQRLKDIEKGEVVGKAVKGAIDAMNAAIMAAVIIPAVCASTSAN